jgi:hypothetical protein
VGSGAVWRKACDISARRAAAGACAAARRPPRAPAF